jgi:hypothetical protein
VYNQDDIAPPAELSTIPEDGKGASLPWSRSQWINGHFSNLINKPNKADKEKRRVFLGAITACALRVVLIPFQKSAVLHLLHVRFQEGSFQS